MNNKQEIKKLVWKTIKKRAKIFFIGVGLLILGIILLYGVISYEINGFSILELVGTVVCGAGGILSFVIGLGIILYSFMEDAI